MQKHAIETWLLARPGQFKVVKEFNDFAKTGGDHERPEFKKMIRLALAGGLDAILVYRLDRFSRNASKAIQLILKLGERNVAFIAADQPVLNADDPMIRNIVLTIFAQVAEMERKTIVDRVKAGMAAAKRKGVKMGAPVKITPDQKVIIFSMRTADYPLREIAREVGLSVRTVRRVLEAPQSPSATAS